MITLAFGKSFLNVCVLQLKYKQNIQLKIVIFSYISISLGAQKDHLIDIGGKRHSECVVFWGGWGVVVLHPFQHSLSHALPA